MLVRAVVRTLMIALAFIAPLAAQVGPVRLLIVPAGPTTVHVGNNLQLNVYEFYFSNTTHMTNVRDVTQRVTYVSSAPGVVLTTAIGLMRPVNNGSAVITAISGPFRSRITLTAVGLTSIAVTPNNDPTIPQGDVQPFTAMGTYTDTTTADITNAVTWNSDATGTFTISNAQGSQGVATAQAAAGTADISASLGSVSSPQVMVTAGPPALEFITVEPPNAHIVNLSDTFPFSAVGHYSNNTTQTITSSVNWASANNGVAMVNPTTGVATGAALGVTTISATQGLITGSTGFNVALNLITVTCDGAGPLPKGDTRQCHAMGRFNSGGPDVIQEISTSVNWVSSAPLAATVNATGLVAAVNANQGANICAFSQAGPLQGCISISTTLARLVSITITGPAQLAIGAAAQYNATGFFADGSQQNITNFVTWSSSAGNVAVISNNGGNHGFLQTGQPGQTTGTSNIQARFTPNALPTVFSNTINLMVNAKSLASITVTPANPVIAVNGTLQFTATPLYSDGSSTPAITPAWSSTAPSVATINGATGLAAGSFPGATTIRATAAGVTGSTTLNVTGTVLTSITVTPANISIAQGATQQYTATGTFSDGSTLDITGSVTWSSSTGAATISASGLATGAAPGPATIRATDPATNIAGSTGLTVTAVTLQSITVAPNPSAVTAGNTLQFTATGHYSDNSAQDITAIVTWSSSVPDFAGINAAGLATGVAPGVTTITAALGAVMGSSQLTVSTATLVSIAVTPADPSIPTNTQLQFTATGAYSDGSTQNLTADPAIVWNSSNTFAATISTTGLASALKGPGITTIGAALGGVSGSTTLTTHF